MEFNPPGFVIVAVLVCICAAVCLLWSAKVAAIIGLALYVIGLLLIFVMHTQMNATFGLAVLRSFLWLLWITVGVPHGSPMPMD